MFILGFLNWEGILVFLGSKCIDFFHNNAWLKYSLKTFRGGLKILGGGGEFSPLKALEKKKHFRIVCYSI